MSPAQSRTPIAPSPLCSVKVGCIPQGAAVLSGFLSPDLEPQLNKRRVLGPSGAHGGSQRPAVRAHAAPPGQGEQEIK